MPIVSAGGISQVAQAQLLAQTITNKLLNPGTNIKQADPIQAQELIALAVQKTT